MQWLWCEVSNFIAAGGGGSWWVRPLTGGHTISQSAASSAAGLGCNSKQPPAKHRPPERPGDGPGDHE